MKESPGSQGEIPPRPWWWALALFLGTGLVFLHFWARQEFTDLILTISSPFENTFTPLLDPILVLLLSIGLSPILTLLGFLLLILAIRPVLPGRLLSKIKALSGGDITGVSANAAAQPEPQPHQDVPIGSGVYRLTAWLGIGEQQLSFLALSLAFAVAAALAAGDGARMRFPLVAVLAWLLGILFALAGGWSRETPVEGEQRRGLKVLIGGFLMVSAVAFAVRAWEVARFPIVLTGDEGSVGLEGVRFLSGQVNNIFRVGWFSFPNLYYLLQGVSIGLFGRSAEALRYPSALAGALTAGAVFLLGQNMFNRRTGILAAFFLAAFSFHIHFSRLGLNNIWDGLAFTLTLGLLWVGWQRERRAAFLTAGLVLGLAQYGYISSRLLWLIIPGWVLLAGLADRHRFRQALPGVALMGWVALITVLPLASFYLRHPADYLWPIQRVADLGTGGSVLQDVSPIMGSALLGQMRLGLAAYLWEPLRFVWYTPGTPILRPLPATLFVLGSLVLALRRIDSRALLLGLWLVAIGLSGGLSDYTPAAQRYVAAAPACALVIAAGLDWLLQLSSSARPGWRGITAGALVILLAIVVLDEVRFYFVDYAPYSALGGSDTLVANHLAEDFKDRPPGWQAAFFGGGRMGFRSIRSLEYLVPQVEGVDMPAPWGSTRNPPLPESDLSFIFLPGEEASLAGVERDFPAGDLEIVRDFEGTVLYWRYDVQGGRAETVP